MIPIISFIGTSGSGKTTILEKVIAELKKRSIRVAVVKHTHHDDFTFDKKGKDTQRYTAAGAAVVIISGAHEIVFMKKTEHDLDPHEISRLIHDDVDLVITEGFKSASTMKIEVHRKALEPELLAKPKHLLAVITDEKLDIKVPQFDLAKNNTLIIADLIEKWLSQQPKREIEINVNGEYVPLNPFVRDIFTKIIEGMLSSLKGVDSINNVKISLHRKS
jgi:molybdopterin-guanine dinucleotide biosynthesis protein MobB